MTNGQDVALAIICVDDEKIVLNSLKSQLKRLFENHTYEILFAESAEEALELIEELEEDEKQIALVVSDQIMPGMKGDQLLIEIHKRHPETLKILLTGQASFEAVQNAINNAGLYRYVNKPWDPEDLNLTIAEACKSFLQKLTIDTFDAQIQLLHQLHRASQDISVEVNLELLGKKFLSHLVSNLPGASIQILIEKEDSPIPYFYFGHSPNEVVREKWLEMQQADFKAYTEILEETCKSHLISHDSGLYVPQKRFALGLEDSKTKTNHGFILLEYHNSPFTAKEFETVRMLTAQASLSIENATLFTQLRQTVNDLSDSIHYARRIQVSLLPSHELLHRHFDESFIYYRPRDVVSGDFYWFAETKEYFFMAVVDCTGHGVPGAFMSILGNSELNKIVNDLGIIETNEILTFLHRMMIATLDHHHETPAHGANVLVLDGMDIALCRFDKKNPKMQFSSANRPLLHIKGDQIQEYQTDKASIGPAYRYYEIFHALELDISPDDTFFLFTDGIVDQFGGPKDKKLTKKRLIEFLTTMQSLPFAEQGLLWEQFMDNWMSHTRQTDDMTLIGIHCPCKG